MSLSYSLFEDVPDVSEDGNQILRNLFVGFSLCEKGIRLPKFDLNDLVYTSLLDLETRLMRWAQAQQSPSHNGFEVWHAKYLAGCCFLVGSRISVYRQTSSISTTTRTTRCAVSMINEVVKEVFESWGAAAFSLLPALAMKRYMLASVARHCEQKRLVTIPEVSRNVAQQFHSPGSPGYSFNPVTLFSKISGENETTIASWLGLPQAPEMASCSWQDLGFASLQNYVDNVATELAYDFIPSSASPPSLQSSCLPAFDDSTVRAVPRHTPLTCTLASTLHSHDRTHTSMQLIEDLQKDIMPLQVQFPSQMIHRSSSDSPRPKPRQRKAKEAMKVSRCSEPSLKQRRLAPRPPQTQSILGAGYHVNNIPFRLGITSDGDTMDSRRVYTGLEGQTPGGDLNLYPMGHVDYADNLLYGQVGAFR